MTQKRVSITIHEWEIAKQAAENDPEHATPTAWIRHLIRKNRKEDS